jgi:hypothetical protein
MKKKSGDRMRYDVAVGEWGNGELRVGFVGSGI